jgi:DNA-directed RNA polymerase specialized sigma24 family protein
MMKTPSMTDMCPPTAWTRIVRARESQSQEAQDARRTLIELYDQPLLRLFQKRLPHRPHDAEDWKQDFLMSHFHTGKLFEHVAPGGRFRNYLARAVRNYIINRLEAEGAKCRSAENAKTYSEISSEDENLANSLADPRSLIDDEELLTRERALSCYEFSIDGVIQWANESGDSEKIRVAEALRRNELGVKRSHKAGSALAATVTQFKELLRRTVRAEVLVKSGQDEQEIVGREIKILLDSLRNNSSLGEMR